MKNGIKSEDVSVVIQGPVDSYTKKSIDSIRKHLPDSEIILSTWNGSNTNGLDYDLLVLNEDPGASYFDPKNKILLNINRWIVSSNNGVKSATKKYVLKCRSDVIMTSTNFLSYWNSFEKTDINYFTFRHKVMIPSLYTLKYIGDNNGHSAMPMPFHISDWYCFGLREDVLLLTDCKIIPDLDGFSKYFENKYVPVEYRWWIDNWLRKMAPEQYIGLSLAKRVIDDIDIVDAVTLENIDEYMVDKFMVSNFIILDPKQFGLLNGKYEMISKYPLLSDSNVIAGMYLFKKYKNTYDHIFSKVKQKRYKNRINKLYWTLKDVKSKLRNVYN